MSSRRGEKEKGPQTRALFSFDRQRLVRQKSAPGSCSSWSRPSRRSFDREFPLNSTRAWLGQSNHVSSAATKSAAIHGRLCRPLRSQSRRHCHPSFSPRCRAAHLRRRIAKRPRVEPKPWPPLFSRKSLVAPQPSRERRPWGPMSPCVHRLPRSFWMGLGAWGRASSHGASLIGVSKSAVAKLGGGLAQKPGALIAQEWVVAKPSAPEGSWGPWVAGLNRTRRRP